MLTLFPIQFLPPAALLKAAASGTFQGIQFNPDPSGATEGDSVVTENHPALP